MSNVLKLHNSLTGRKEEFVPIDPAHVRVYACGPTVYSYAHIGNARMAVAFDLLVRVLRLNYPKVTYASNITDVDDKIMNAARESGEPISAITEKFTRIYNGDMASLGVLPPDVQPKATEHIPEMIALIGALIERGHAYEAAGHAMFNVPSFPAYGKLSGRSRDDQIAGARVEISPFKKDPADFVLWKPSTDDQPGWDSPWGRGRPGWHIECSAMTEKHLGLPFDIHGGGADLKFPHHENEIAQSCCAHGHENDPTAFAKYWVHNGFVTVEGEKMSKSLGNFTLAHDLLEGRPAHFGNIIRLALLSAHYRQPLDWGAQAIHQAEKLYEKIVRATEALKDIEAQDQGTDDAEGILAALHDDLNTPLAIAKLNGILSSVFSPDGADALPSLKAALQKSLTILGVNVIAPPENGQQADAGIDKLLAERVQAKKDKNFARADEIRKELEAQGIVIEDTPTGPKWRRA
ncbi:MAG: cysS [Micavibrio sp.]|nr:cysS [Micavibrio sp.]